MKLKDLQIRTKLICGFSLMLLLIVIMGWVALSQSSHYAQLANMEKFMIEKEVDHFKWASKVKDLFLNNLEKLEVQTDPTQCGLGKWYYAFIKSPEFAALPKELQDQILSMEEPHKHLHESAGEIGHTWHKRHIGLRNSLLNALDAHKQWASNVATALLEGKTPDVQTDPHQCAFGKWTNSPECRTIMDAWPEFSSVMQPLLEEHKKLHQSVLEINKALTHDEKVSIFTGTTHKHLVEVEKNLRELIKMETANQTRGDNARAILHEKTEPILHKLLGIFEDVLKNTTALADKSRTVMTSTIITALLIGIAVVIAATILLSGLIVNPIRRIIDMLTDIAQGEGDLTKRIPEDAKDETGELAHWFNLFVEKIENLIVQIRDAAEQLQASTGDIANSSQQISDGAQQQSASFEELSSSVQSNATNASQSDEIANSTAQKAQSVGSGMENTIEAMDEIEKSSKQISTAVAIISDIADQTNLLALNAAIEAARAGEHGKGFAVVADEVRKLAERSAVSAKEITDLIKTSSGQVEKGASLSRDAGESLKDIIDSINEMATQIKSISESTQEQAATMEENTSITESNASASEELAAAAEEMAGQAESLKNMVGQFKIRMS